MSDRKITDAAYWNGFRVRERMNSDNRKTIARLKRRYSRLCNRRPRDVQKCYEFQKSRGMEGWEIFVVPESMFYREVLAMLSLDDVVFDVGAGDLRFDIMLSEKVKKVYAVEINPVLLGGSLKTVGYDLPLNVVPICGNAFEMELPRDVTVITCLMIHRQHVFPQHWKRCRIIYAGHDGVEVIESTPYTARL